MSINQRWIGPYDRRFFNEFASQPEIYAPELEDGYVIPDNVDWSSCLTRPDNLVWAVFSGNRMVAGFRFIRQSELHWEAHCSILAVFRGKLAKEWGFRASRELSRLFDQPVTLSTVVPGHLPHSRYLVSQWGFKQVGQIENCFLKGGKLHHKHIYARTI